MSECSFSVYKNLISDNKLVVNLIQAKVLIRKNNGETCDDARVEMTISISKCGMKWCSLHCDIISE